MTQQLVTSSLPAASIGNQFGYRFDGDRVELNADIQCYSPAHAGLDWALQLWADEAIKIAELPLGQLFPDNQGKVVVNGVAVAMLPAGSVPHALSLKLVSGFNGMHDCLHDQRDFEVLQGFEQPRLRDPVECRLDGEEFFLDIAGIENPREVENLSGTLVLEIWSLDSPYTGGAWQGTPLASLVVGCLQGQSEWAESHFTAKAAPIPEGGHPTLMLREWTEAGYVTRDYRALPSLRTPGVVEMVASPDPLAPVELPAPQIEPAVMNDPEEERLPVNQASPEEIVALKGVSRHVAQGIVESRPFESVDDLIRVKGIGPKLLEKLRRIFRV